MDLGKENKDKKNNRDLALTENTRGENAINLNDFNSAEDHFKKAINTTDSEDSKLSTYKANLVRARAGKLNKEGSVLLTNGKVKDAIEKFKLALEIMSPHKSTFANDERNYKNNLAEAYNRQGDFHFKNQEFDLAQSNYKQAVDLNPSDQSKLDTYRLNLKKSIAAQNNIAAEKLNQEGWIEFNKRNYQKAAEKFLQAYKKADSEYENKQSFLDNSNRALAEQFNKEGEEFFIANNYEQALKKFQNAKNIAPEKFKSSYDQNVNKAQAEVSNKEGLELYKKERYEKAIKKFNEASKLVPSTFYHRQIAIRDNLANAQNKYGEVLFSEKKYKKSLHQFEQAFNNASEKNENRVKIVKNKNLANWEVKYEEAQNLIKNGKMYEAYNAIEEVLNSIPEERMNRLEEIIEFKSNAAEGIGDIYFRTENYLDAKEKYQESRGLTKDEDLKIKLTKKMGDAQSMYFDVTYEEEMNDLSNISSEEHKIRNLIKMIDIFEDTMKLNSNPTVEMKNKLDNMIKELLTLRAFDQVKKLNIIGNTYFPEDPEYKKTLEVGLQIENDNSVILEYNPADIDDLYAQIERTTKYTTA